MKVIRTRHGITLDFQWMWNCILCALWELSTGGKLVDKWKIVNNMVVFENANKKDLQNYRPNLVICSFNKKSLVCVYVAPLYLW